jgi:hypothetical protein
MVRGSAAGDTELEAEETLMGERDLTSDALFFLVAASFLLTPLLLSFGREAAGTLQEVILGRDPTPTEGASEVSPAREAGGRGAEVSAEGGGEAFSSLILNSNP